MNALDYIVARLREPSTWAGIAVFFGMFGIDSDMITRITANAPAVVTAVGALIAIFAPHPPISPKNQTPDATTTTVVTPTTTTTVP
jgi:hypothetical protein